MKKFLSLTLALLLILSMTATAFADDVTYAPTGAVSGVEQITKTYSSNGIVVNETLKFKSEAKTTNPDYYLDDGTTQNEDFANLTVYDLEVTSLTNGVAGNVKFDIPSLSKAGRYEWVIKEDMTQTGAVKSAGVDYTGDEIHVIVQVGYDNDNHKLIILNNADGEGVVSYIQGEVKTEDDGTTTITKKDTFNNTLTVGSFDITKDVSGNMANENDTFTVKVTLTSDLKVNSKIKVGGTEIETTKWTQDSNTKKWSYTTDVLTISESGTPVTISNVPKGVMVSSVQEQNLDDKNETTDGYKFVGVVTRVTTGEGENQSTTDTDFAAFDVSDTEVKHIVVKNEKNATVATGVSLDTVPYFLMLAVACVGMFLLLSKKRAYREN